MSSTRPTTLHARLALWYAAMITVVLSTYTAAVFVFAVDEPDQVDPDPARAIAEQTERDLAEHQLLIVLGVGLVASLATAVGGGFLLTRRSLAPLSQIVAVCRTLEIGDLAKRVAEPDGATAEIRELANTLNSTLARLERSVGGLRRFTADASHELRTPLARMQGRLELALRNSEIGEVGAALEDLADVVRVIEALLTLAHADAGDVVHKTSQIDLGALVKDVVAPYEPVAAERAITLSVGTDAGCTVRGDDAAMKRIVANLVDNACKYTPAGGLVHVAVKREGLQAVVVVTDSGPGVAANDRERVFERFFRSERTRALPGVGLGLAISRDLARAHGGDVHLVPTALGASFLVALPLVGENAATKVTEKL